YSSDPSRAPSRAGEQPEPGNGTGGTSMDAKANDTKRLAPRSPRSALEPDTIELPQRRTRSKSVRHPVVIIGNAIFSLCVLLAVVVGFAVYVGNERFEAPGPLQQDKVVVIPHGSGIRDITEVLQREGVI